MFFSKQCQPISNKSTLLSSQSFENIYILSTVDIDSKKVRRNTGFECWKAHGHDGLPLRMLNFCELPVIKSLPLLFGNC